MKTSALLVAAALSCGTSVLARPIVIEESARIANPVPDLPNVAGVDVDGDDAVVVLHRDNPGDEEGYGQTEDLATWLLRRVNGTWTAVREIDRVNHSEYYLWYADVAMKDGVLALARNPLAIFERRNGDWVRMADGLVGDEHGTAVEIDSGRILFGGSSGPFKGTLFERDPATGAWRQTTQMVGEYRGGDDEFSGSQVDLQGNQAAIHSRYSEEPNVATPSVTIYQLDANGWGYRGVIRHQPESPLFELGGEVATRGDEIFITGPARTGTHVFRPTPPGSWSSYWPYDHLQPLDGFMGGGRSGRLKKNALFVLQHSLSWDRQGGVVHVFQKNTAGNYENVATLAASGGDSIGRFGISGRRVIAACGGEVCVFEIPTTLTQPAARQDIFTAATPNGWTLSAGSRFTVEQSGVSRVLRQAEVASTATHAATLDASANWRNQAIEADVRITAFNGTDRWAGLATRYRDAANHYYVTLRRSGSVHLRKMVNGTFTAIASAPLAVTPGRVYRVRLESIGTRHRVYVDGAPVLDADDSALASGRAAVLTFQTAAEFDNVVVSPTPLTTDYAANFNDSGVADFTQQGGLWTRVLRGTNAVLEQSSVAGDARAAVGVPTDNQTVEARVRPTTFAGAVTGDRWVGLMARHVDFQNYYYLTLRSSNTVSLRKLVNNQVTVLRTSALPVTLGQTYALRLEVVGTRLRAYVNGNLLLEATDTSLTSGTAGLITYRAAADFDDFRFVQP
jgi:hypothetical protein